MSRTTIDFDLLAQETLELSQNLRRDIIQKSSQSPHQEDLFSFTDFSNLTDDSLFDFSEDENGGSEDVYEAESPAFEGPGLLFVIDKGISTFCLRALPCDDLEWEWDKVLRKDAKTLEYFRLGEDWSLDDFRVYPTKDQAEAEMIADQMVNRRFPRQEAILCNLSDPGFSWWMDVSESQADFQIYFQSHGIDRDSSYTKLGPLGDPMIACHRLSRAIGHLQGLISINEYSATDKAFMISSSKRSCEKFSSFLKIFTVGEFPWQEELEKSSGEKQTLLLYLRELASLRRFWLGVEKELS